MKERPGLYLMVFIILVNTCSGPTVTVTECDTAVPDRQKNED